MEEPGIIFTKTVRSLEDNPISDYKRMKDMEDKRTYYKDCPTCNGRVYNWVTDRAVCDKHNTCYSCGINRKDLKEGEVPWGAHKGVFTCNDCVVKEQNESILTYNSPDDKECYGSEPKCPCCGAEYFVEVDEGDLYEDGSVELDCPTCTSKFMCVVVTSIDYTCTKILPKR